jgi:hypothetical protein
VKNYSSNQLNRILPSHQVIQQGNVQRTTITTGEGLMQEIFIIKEYSSDQDKNNKEESTLFVSSLLVNDLSSLPMASARDILKPQTNEVL